MAQGIGWGLHRPPHFHDPSNVGFTPWEITNHYGEVTAFAT
jgi:hypothetical protein